MSRASWLKAFALAAALLGFGGVGRRRPRIGPTTCTGPTCRPRSPATGSNTTSLHDGFYLYPREQRIVPQIQGPYYRNFYGG